MIHNAGINHTSMSVGDIVKKGSTYYIVAGIGFLKVKLTKNPQEIGKW